MTSQDDCHNEAWFQNEVTKEFENKFNLEEIQLTFAFIDAWAKHPDNIGDQLQQSSFERETGILWNFATTSENVEFKSIQDVLVENLELKIKNQYLEDLIQFNLTDMVEMIKTNVEEIAQV